MQLQFKPAIEPHCPHLLQIPRSRTEAESVQSMKNALIVIEGLRGRGSMSGAAGVG